MAKRKRKRLPGNLSVEAEIALCERMRSGDESARNELVEANLAFCTYMARRFVCQGLAFDDLVGEARLAMLESCKTYDGSSRFIHYAGYFIRMRLWEFAAHQGAVVSMPKHRFRSVRMLQDAEHELSAVLQRFPTDEELCQHLRWKPLLLKRARLASGMRRAPMPIYGDSARAPTDERSRVWRGGDNAEGYEDVEIAREHRKGNGVERIMATADADPALIVEKQEDMERLQAALQKLPRQQRRILLRRMAGDTFNELRVRFKLSKAAIIEQINEALSLLKLEMDA